MTGLRGTTTAALAERAGISEPVLYIHFKTKDHLFKETVERNIEERHRTLEGSLALVAERSLSGSVESMALATVAACMSGTGNAVLTNWALLEAPEYAIDLCRLEVGLVCEMWERRLAERFPGPRSRTLISMRLVPYAVHACLAYGFWLATFRHTPESASPLARQFAAGLALVAPSLISSD